MGVSIRKARLREADFRCGHVGRGAGAEGDSRYGVFAGADCSRGGLGGNHGGVRGCANGREVLGR